MSSSKCFNCGTTSKKYLGKGSNFLACSKCGYLWVRSGTQEERDLFDVGKARGFR